MNPLLLLALLLGGGGRRMFRDIDQIPHSILPNQFFSGAGASGTHTHDREAVLQWLHDRIRSDSPGLDLAALLPLLVSQTSGQAPAAMLAPTTTATVPATYATPAGIDPNTLLALLLLLRPLHDDR